MNAKNTSTVFSRTSTSGEIGPKYTLLGNKSIKTILDFRISLCKNSQQRRIPRIHMYVGGFIVLGFKISHKPPTQNRVFRVASPVAFQPLDGKYGIRNNKAVVFLCVVGMCKAGSAFLHHSPRNKPIPDLAPCACCAASSRSGLYRNQLQAATKQPSTSACFRGTIAVTSLIFRAPAMPCDLVSRHLRRLQDSAHALAFEAVPSSQDVTTAIMATLAANGMVDGAHARVTLSRGTKTTSSMNPEFNVFG